MNNTENNKSRDLHSYISNHLSLLNENKKENINILVNPGLTLIQKILYSLIDQISLSLSTQIILILYCLFLCLVSYPSYLIKIKKNYYL